MTRDQMDDLLDASAPTAQTIAPSDVRAMVLEARTQAPPSRPRRRTKAGLAAVSALALVLGGGGVAVAAGIITWPDNLQNPDTSFAFEVPSGRACEVRLVVEPVAQQPDDPSPDRDAAAAVQAEATQWLRSVDLQASIDLETARNQAERILTEQHEVGMTIVIGADGWLADAALADRAPDADDVEAFAVDRAVRAAMAAHLAQAGYPEGDWVFSSDGGVKCATQ
ncbi:hypothetical protein M2317_000136 [Microbacterium sp. ZKA21]|jgi:hypothetical protein|uniref:hypothetical protein n=1 Tax=Microbacterium sp. ZKA21 TaxID=3381694 RepID=UPI003D1FD410